MGNVEKIAIRRFWKRGILGILLFALPAFCFSQKFVDPREANSFYKDGNYLAAMKGFKDLIQSDPKNVEYHYKLGMCYLKSNVDKGQAVQYFEWITKQPKCDFEVWYELGKAYHYANKFPEAIKAFNKFKELTTNAADKV